MKRRPPVAQFCALDHVMISPDGGGFLGVTDEALARVGLTRRVVLSVPHFLFVISVLASTDLVAMLPLHLVCGLGGSLRMVDPPIDAPGYELAMLWHVPPPPPPGHIRPRGYLSTIVLSPRTPK